MLAWVVIYRRHLQHSTAIPSSLRLCVKLSASQRSNLPLCSPFPLRHYLLTSLPHDHLPALAPSGSTHHCFKSFSCNTYRSPRKCCKQKTYVPAKFFRCNLQKTGGGGSRQRSSVLPFNFQLSTVNLLRPVLPRITGGHGSRPTIPRS